MQKAYDTFLQSEVSARLAAKSSGSEPYRYECAHCGEDVSLAAIHSSCMVPHFRHRSGNNDIECEKYLGQYGIISVGTTRKSKNERAEFYFDSNTKMFYIGLRFSDTEINAYEKSSAVVELRTSIQEQSFLTLPINSQNFIHDCANMLPLERFSCDYFLSNTLNDIKRRYEVFKSSENAPTFFKVQVNKAKLVRGSVLYTNTPYLVTSIDPYWLHLGNYLPNEIKIDKTFKFTTMGEAFLGQELTILAKTDAVDGLLNSWGYTLEMPETLALLWPPSTIVNEITFINTNYAYLYSTFELQAHGNINVEPHEIEKHTKGISRILINSRVNVYRKNAELTLDNHNQVAGSLDSIQVTEESKDIHSIPSDNGYFLFDCNGVTPLNRGISIYLTPKSKIQHYMQGYLCGCIYPKRQLSLTDEQLLCEIIAFYKRMESFKRDDFDLSALRPTASKYLESCEASGMINSAAKRFIEEGRI